MLIKVHEDDVDYQLAYDAYRAISFTPEKRAEETVSRYLQEMAKLDQEFSQYATKDNQGDLAFDLCQYQKGYLVKMHAYLQALSRCMSSMIVGPANFPVRSNEKRNNTADKRRDEWLEYINKGEVRLRRTYNPRLIANAPISSDDDQAIEKLQAKIDKAEKAQAMMKAANKIIRSKKLSDEEKVVQVGKIDGIGKEAAQSLVTKTDFAGRLGFPSYQLTNNNANVKRMKARIEQLRREKERATVDDVEINGVTISENREENRLQLFFDGKPSIEVRQKLKANGFRWAPSQGAWQRQLNEASRRVARQLLEDI